MPFRRCALPPRGWLSTAAIGRAAARAAEQYPANAPRTAGSLSKAMPMAGQRGPALRTAGDGFPWWRGGRRSGGQQRAGWRNATAASTSPASKAREPSSAGDVAPAAQQHAPPARTMNVTFDALYGGRGATSRAARRCVVAQHQADDERHELQDRHGPHQRGDVEGDAPPTLAEVRCGWRSGRR